MVRRVILFGSVLAAICLIGGFIAWSRNCGVAMVRAQARFDASMDGLEITSRYECSGPIVLYIDGPGDRDVLLQDHRDRLLASTGGSTVYIPFHLFEEGMQPDDWDFLQTELTEEVILEVGDELLIAERTRASGEKDRIVICAGGSTYER